ncbi:MAG: universal stress protein [Candidatus Nitrosocaldaceae archaeon]|nr:MAG: universal stress protein [Candidatus Nitrosocaldaceae archaeon]
MYKTILVPYDVSKHSDHALKHAVKLAKNFNSKLILLHVIPDIPFPPTLLNVGKILRSKKTGEVITSREYLKELYNEMKNEAIKMLNDEIKDFDITIDIRILVGHPAKQIIEFLKKEKIDLIVMGTSGLSGLSKIKALGSVSRYVIENTNVPILLIH